MHKPGHIAVGRERVEVDIGPQHLEHLDTIVDPLLVPDLATMVWAPHGHHDAVEALRRLANIVLVDTQDEPEVARGVRARGRPARSAYVVDLAWLRTTPWRERIAATFDPPAMRRALGAIDKVVVRHRADSTAAGVLLCGWLASRLGWRPEVLAHRGDQLTGHARARRGEVALELHPADLGAPGPRRRDHRDGVGRGGLARPRPGRAARGAAHARRRGADLDGDGRLARRSRASSARACARRCCAIRRTSPRSRRAACWSGDVGCAPG